MTNGGSLKLGGVFGFECRDKQGNLKWSTQAHNIVTDTGLEHLMKLAFTNSTTAITTWYVGLLADTVITATDIMSGISEATEYLEATRPVWTEALTAATKPTVSNTGNLATFSINKDGTTVDGAFIASSENAGGSAGILFSGAPFTGGSKTGDSGDVLTVTYTLTAEDDGA